MVIGNRKGREEKRWSACRARCPFRMFKNAVVGGPWGELGVSECNGQKWNAGTDTEDADARSSLELELQSIRNLLSCPCSSGGCVGGLRGVDVIRRGRAPVRMRLPAFHRSPSWSPCLAPSLPSSAHCARASRPGKNRSSLTTLTTQSPQGRAEPWPIRWTQCAGHSTGAEAALEHMAIIKSTRHRTEWASNRVEVNKANPKDPLL